MKNNIDEYMSLLNLAVGSIKECHNNSGIIESEDYGNIDFLSMIPTLTELNEANIKILTVPYFIEPSSGKDMLVREIVELSDYKEKIEKYSHIYSIMIVRAITIQLSHGYKIAIRGVLK